MSSYYDSLMEELDPIAAEVDRGEEFRRKASAEAAEHRRRLRDQRIWGAAPPDVLGRQAALDAEMADIPSLTDSLPADLEVGSWSSLYRGACNALGGDEADQGARILIREARAAFLRSPKGNATAGDLDAIYRETMRQDPASRAAEFVAVFAQDNLAEARRTAQLAQEPLDGLDEPNETEAMDALLDSPEEEPFDVAGQDPEEAAIPHEESTEEMSTVESPITGEELVIELGVSEGAGMPKEDVQALPYVAQLLDLGGLEEDEPVAGDFGDLEEDPKAVDAEQDEELALAENSEEEATTTLMIDPTTDTGELIEVTLKPASQSVAEAESNVPENEYEAFMDEGETRGEEPAWRGSARSAAEAWKRISRALDIPPTAQVRGQDHEIERSAWIVWNGGESRLHVVAVPAEEQATRRKASLAKEAPKPTRKALLAAAEDRGLTSDSVENTLLARGQVQNSVATLRLVNGFDVELTVAGRKRKASLAGAQELIEQYILAEAGVNWSRKADLQRREASLSEEFGGRIACQNVVETDCYDCGRRTAWLDVADEFPCECGFVIDKSEVESQLRSRRAAGLEGLWVLQADLPESDEDTSKVRASRIAKSIQALVPNARPQYRVAARQVVAELRASEERVHRVLQELMGRFGLERTSMQLADSAAQTAARTAQLAEDPGDAPAVPDADALAVPADEAVPVDLAESPEGAPAAVPVEPAVPAGPQISILHEADQERIRDAARYFRSVRGLSRVEAIGEILGGGSRDVGTRALEAIAREPDDPARGKAGDEIEMIVNDVYSKPLVQGNVPSLPNMPTAPVMPGPATPPAPLPEVPEAVAPEATELVPGEE